MECARSRETARRSALGEAAGYGYCAAHSRYFWGFRLHLLAAPDGTPRAFTLADPARDEREVALTLLERCRRDTREVFVCDKGYAGREFAACAGELGVLVVRPRRQDEPGEGPRLASIRQRIESIFWTCKDLLTLERHGRAPWRDCASVSCRGSSAWRPASASTTAWAGRAGLSSGTAPEAAGVESII